ncbi:MAG: TonB-dependent receptor, partial [Olleya sp.]
LENQQFGDEHGLGVNDAGIESIEVIKGPASLLYGSDALGGVLYLNPERYASENESITDLNTRYFTNTQGYSTNIGFKKSADEFKFLIRASQAEHSDYETKNYSVTNTRFREQDLKAGIGYQNTHFKTDFRYNVNLSKLGIPEEVEAQSNARTPLEPFQSLANHILSSKSTWFFDNSSLDVNLGFIYNDRKEFEDHHHEDEDEHDEDEDHDEEEDLEDEAPALHMKLKTFNYDVKYNLPTLGKFETIVGLQGMHQINTNYGEELLIPNATTNDVGVLATSHIHFETFDIQLGARFDNRNIEINNSINKQFNSFNGAAGVKANVLNNVVLRLNLATGFRAPNLSELASDGTHEGTNRYEIGNIDLKNEQNFQSDLALEYSNEHFEVFANGFYNHINNYIFISPNGETIDDTPVFNYLQSNARLYGGEFGLHLHPHPLDWLHIESSFETVTGQQENDAYLPLIPANSLTNTLRVEFENNTFKKSYAFVRYRSTFAQNNVSNFETTTANYNLLSAGFGTTITVFNNPLNLSVSGTNLTDKVYINHLSRLKSEGIANMGRNISFGLSYTL